MAFSRMGAVVAGTVVWSLAATAASADPKADEILKQTRAALGGEAKLGAVKGLTAEGSYRRLMGDREMSGDLELTFQIPGRFQRVERFTRPDGMPGPAVAQTVDGETGWAGPIGGSGGGMVMMRFAGPDGREPDPAAIANRLRPEFARLLLTMLLSPGTADAFDFSYAGQAESPDGKADVIDVKGANEFTAKLFVASESHLPLMLRFEAPDSRRMMRVVTGDGPRGPGGGGGSGGGPGANLTPEQRRQRMEEMRKRMEAEGPPPPPPQVEHTLYVADHKKVDGVLLPHRFSHAVAGETTEEWTIEKFKVNPSIKADQFKKP
ncbi:MAG: hypothetical protein U0Q12_14080 [Vicinamibacterales bacterium]